MFSRLARCVLMRCWFDYNEYDIPDDIEARLGVI